VLKAPACLVSWWLCIRIASFTTSTQTAYGWTRNGITNHSGSGEDMGNRTAREQVEGRRE